MVRVNLVDAKLLTDESFIKRFESFFDKTEGCWLWRGNQEKRRYGSFRIKNKTYLPHRISKFIYDGFDLRSDKIIMHVCDNRYCVNPKHLQIATQKDNVIDMFNKNRNNTPKGEKCLLSKLKESDVLSIIKKHKKGISNLKISKEYGVASSTIDRIVSGKTWKHIGDNLG